MKKIFIYTFLFYIFFTISPKAEIIKDFKITGNNRISKEDLISLSELKKGQDINNGIINNTLKKIYSTGNFGDISIEIKNNILNIDVIETPIIGDIFFIGSNKFDEDEIKKNLSVKSRQIYSKSKIKLDAEKLAITFKKMGFLNVSIEPKVVFLEDNSVDIIFNIDEGDISKINKIYFNGNNNISDSILEENILSRKDGLLSLTGSDGNFEEEKLNYDKQLIEDYYKNNGFANAKVTNIDTIYDKKKYNFDIYFKINEGNKYNFGKATINKNIYEVDKQKKINKFLKMIKTGKTFEANKIKEVQYKISNYLKSLGYANIIPNYSLIYNNENKTIDIYYDIIISQKVYIDKIYIIGNERTRNNVILREMLINEGDLYDKDKIELSKNKIWMLGFFKNVDIREQLIPNSDLINLEIVVEEQFSGRINLTLGYSTFYGISGGIDFTIHNFLGKGFTASIAAERNGYSEGGSISFYDPYIFSDKYPIGLNAGISYNHFGSLWGATKYTRNLMYQGHSYKIYGGFSFEIMNRLTLNTTLSTSMYYYKWKHNSSYKLYQLLLGTRFAHMASLSLTWNQLNRARYATKGYLLRYTFNIAGFGIPNSQQFIQNQIDFNANMQIIGEDLILHLEGSAGLTTGLKKSQLLGMEYLYTLGGYSRMRGFDFYGIGPRINSSTDGDYYYASEGNKFYYASIELRTPLFIPKDLGIYFSAFIDIGSVWGFSGKTKYLEYEKNGYHVIEKVKDGHSLRMSVGVALTWNSQILGEIGVYYAHPILKTGYDRTLEFGIKMGHTF